MVKLRVPNGGPQGRGRGRDRWVIVFRVGGSQWIHPRQIVSSLAANHYHSNAGHSIKQWVVGRAHGLRVARRPLSPAEKKQKNDHAA